MVKGKCGFFCWLGVEVMLYVVVLSVKFTICGETGVVLWVPLYHREAPQIWRRHHEYVDEKNPETQVGSCLTAGYTNCVFLTSTPMAGRTSCRSGWAMTGDYH
ncbi:hypothetical protein AVEN_67066-1 [Araneus ventricosus]|uniref:Uncharacterized protein n=1 Tax=Araneus ventricosus TaxID=182803 RepID=A0A4Y2V0A1_ARAVE|nr:hypothetical protein AVEN_67066-1 [Araneus ventricosus]